MLYFRASFLFESRVAVRVILWLLENLKRTGETFNGMK